MSSVKIKTNVSEIKFRFTWKFDS